MVGHGRARHPGRSEDSCLKEQQEDDHAGHRRVAEQQGVYRVLGQLFSHESQRKKSEVSSGDIGQKAKENAGGER